jgi:triacylglycerol lipase
MVAARIGTTLSRRLGSYVGLAAFAGILAKRTVVTIRGFGYDSNGMGVVRLPRLPSGPVIPERPHLPPLWRESRVALEIAGLRRSGVWQGEGVLPGDGRPVLLIPGFLAGDGSLAMLTEWLRTHEYQPTRAGIRANVSCSSAACDRLEQRVEAFAEQAGEPVTIVGQSRGGVFARALATRRPDLVAGIVTLGAPTLSQLRIHPLVLAQVGLVAALGTGRVPGLFSLECLRGQCCEEFRTALESPFPAGIPWTAIYSRSDGIVDWRACVDPQAGECVEVSATHVGMALNAAVYREIARFLNGLVEPVRLAA